ncbi:MAG: hypothetical protein LBF04_00295 [Prevotellaceae bacterium]|jgi:hypothetical protein|nr:hypothetical protein [Prevotellaceae bacterium]
MKFVERIKQLQEERQLPQRKLAITAVAADSNAIAEAVKKLKNILS